MQISPAYASKLIKQKKEEINILLKEESDTSVTVACIDEDVDSMRNQYNFTEMQNKIEKLYQQILKLKHAINYFNATTILPNTNYTIDAALVRMKMLSDNKRKLENMKKMQSVTRRPTIGNNKPEYIYRNFDSEDVNIAYNKVSDELTNIQLELDKANLQSVLSVDIDN